ncbi:plastid terminal oxidase [Galdieria sulphuraria]|uniref:Plastid terminal oxidase n=1 Tax=Galdieria sulphuraria TaxID=130081 RepID=M2XXT1_GALSU|nr:plastid terminal oxidase [Galdieria sulphuraria]EME28423.1 plastid terminal oxidase [Galdieria sulphuraria]|eukprot:XP_005704943.1 plastid terminal oxidase [Galdieria sulphuraria]
MVAYLCFYWNTSQSVIFYKTRQCKTLCCNKGSFSTKPKFYIRNKLKRPLGYRVQPTMEDRTNFATTSIQGDSNSTGESNISQAVGYSEESDMYVDLRDSPNFQVKPAGVISLAWLHFRKELDGLIRSMGQFLGWIEKDEWIPPDCFGFRLDNEKVFERQRERESKQESYITTPRWSRWIYDALCGFIDWAYKDRPVERFWFLETVARMPYFSYISVLHLYETLGWWRNGELLKIHFAEEYNEFHHLLIMESLGGDRKWLDRFVAEHAAVFYYWILVLYFFLSPSLAYNFSELVEAHAVDTYTEFLQTNEELLKQLPPPKIAERYYLADNLYMFDEIILQVLGDLLVIISTMYFVIFVMMKWNMSRQCMPVRITQNWVK